MFFLLFPHNNFPFLLRILFYLLDRLLGLTITNITEIVSLVVVVDLWPTSVENNLVNLDVCRYLGWVGTLLYTIPHIHQNWNSSFIKGRQKFYISLFNWIFYFWDTAFVVNKLKLSIQISQLTEHWNIIRSLRDDTSSFYWIYITFGGIY